ncbi:FAD-dependent oxidoreductase [Myceligenerans salitolerans]|uniref:NAD(P)/FAD-dependent oxidoreductase n=1 Tax=Myceligenerans salitolerans TaxID=1230528 RepID=A0ABS3I9H9_9MICO|nr:FAD-dependent oxidoreductase [Myceligenerans salitolerans]MBO0609609.1 NAD(P)/FAD-dependent oxidoreductase [Myceligenerans salitolerans]
MSLRVPLRIVVIGFGMVGGRFVDELLRRDTDDAFDVTVLGAEPYEPYNRVLLSDVVAGRTDVAAIGMPMPDLERVDLRRGVGAVSIDRQARVVVADDGSRHPYDHLVLATGSEARIPPVPGLGTGGSAGLPAGAHALRTLDDAREIVAATVNTPRAVVVGGGVLGVEAAYGLAARGLEVTIVDGAPSLMARQLDGPAGEVLAAGLAARGVTVRAGVLPSEVLVAGGRVVGVRLGNDDVVAAGLVVLSTGTVPTAGIARAAGLATDRGIVVGHDLTSPDDEAICAIGDCAQPPEGSRGLVAEGWDQARRLAERFADEAAARAAASAREAAGLDPAVGASAVTGGPREHLRFPDQGERPSMAVRLGTLLGSQAVTRTPSDTGIDTRGTDVVKVKAGDLSIVSMGAAGLGRSPRPGERAVRLADPAGGRFVEAVVADGVLVGATCVGDPRVAADLTAAYTRRIPAPADPAFLLITPIMPTAAPVDSPEHMPDDAVVCRCNGVTKGEIAGCCASGTDSLEEIAAETRATTGCGSCREAVCGIAAWVRSARPTASELDPSGAQVPA